MKKEKRKSFLLKGILIFLALVILGYDTYQVHFSKRRIHMVENLSVEYENAGNLLFSNLKDNMQTSLKVKVKNETDEPIFFKISFADVVNDLEYIDSITYTFSKEKGDIEIHSGIFPRENLDINDGDEVGPHEEVDYVLTVRTNHMKEEDINKSIQARIKLIETESELS